MFGLQFYRKAELWVWLQCLPELCVGADRRVGTRTERLKTGAEQSEGVNAVLCAPSFSPYRDAAAGSLAAGCPPSP
jgi:hypothetical protein